jgi:glycosyltransferase involved in cell wall biosynthesis
MILVDALFINKGGGAVLLDYLIAAILNRPERDNFFFLLDPRYKKNEQLNKNFTIIKNSLKERNKFYSTHQQKFSCVFSFANTPPPIKLQVPTYTYLHNQKLLEAPYRKFEKKFFKLYLKYLVMKWYNGNTDYYIVQTPHMVDELLKLKLKDAQLCITIPFYDNSKYKVPTPSFESREKDNFVFISNPSPQKNYPTLLDAWEVLLEQGRKPTLHVTIDDTAPELVQRVAQMKERGISIINHVYVEPSQLYFNYPYLIFPSVMESFGLPLLEATDSGMKVLASGLPYVHDVIEPSLTFDPLDKNSIAAAVVTAMKENLPFPRVLTTDKLQQLIDLLVK